jgi:hypothetical protein
METAGICLGLTNIFVAILIIGISIPLVMRKIPMNRFYGVRFKKSFESDENWYKINHYGGKQLIAWSIPLLIIGILTFVFPVREDSMLTTLIGCAPLIVLVPAYLSYKYASKL